MATAPDYRRQGIGKRLLSHALLNLMREGTELLPGGAGKQPPRRKCIAGLAMKPRAAGGAITGITMKMRSLMSLGSLNADRLGVNDGDATPDQENNDGR